MFGLSNIDFSNVMKMEILNQWKIQSDTKMNYLFNQIPISTATRQINRKMNGNFAVKLGFYGMKIVLEGLKFPAVFSIAEFY